MAFVYNEVGWENLPSTNTPRNATNLGNMDTGIKENNDMLLGTKPAGNMIVDSIRSKNILNLYNNTITKSNAAYAINNENSINVGSAGGWAYAMVEDFVVNPNTNYVFSCNLLNNQIVNAGIIIYDDNGNTLNFQNTTNTSDTLEIPFYSPTSIVKIKFACNNTSEIHNNATTYYDIMVELGTSKTDFMPYQEINAVDIKKNALQIKPNIGLDANNMKENGIYWYNAGLSNIPSEQYGVLLVFTSPDGTPNNSWWIIQIAISTQNSIFKRVSTDEGATWTNWIQI